MTQYNAFNFLLRKLSSNNITTIQEGLFANLKILRELYVNMLLPNTIVRITVGFTSALYLGF